MTQGRGKGDETRVMSWVVRRGASEGERGAEEGNRKIRARTRKEQDE